MTQLNNYLLLISAFYSVFKFVILLMQFFAESMILRIFLPCCCCPNNTEMTSLPSEPSMLNCLRWVTFTSHVMLEKSKSSFSLCCSLICLFAIAMNKYCSRNSRRWAVAAAAFSVVVAVLYSDNVAVAPATYFCSGMRFCHYRNIWN